MVDPQERRLDLCSPARYCITVQGHLDRNRAIWFDPLELCVHDGQTSLIGLVADQVALHGLLAKVRDLGLPLVAVRWLAEGEG